MSYNKYVVLRTYSFTCSEDNQQAIIVRKKQNGSTTVMATHKHDDNLTQVFPRWLQLTLISSTTANNGTWRPFNDGGGGGGGHGVRASDSRRVRLCSRVHRAVAPRREPTRTHRRIGRPGSPRVPSFAPRAKPGHTYIYIHIYIGEGDRNSA